MGKMVFWVPDDGFVAGRGYRASIVKEGESGHQPTGVWPYDVHQPMPYFWGDDLNKARETAYRQNERLGISREETDRIVNESIATQVKKKRRVVRRER